MTAEERARDLAKRFWANTYGLEEDDIRIAMDAIRSAEDDALERAAQAIEKHPHVESGAVMDGPWFADVVRSLKSGGSR